MESIIRAIAPTREGQAEASAGWIHRVAGERKRQGWIEGIHFRDRARRTYLWIR